MIDYSKIYELVILCQLIFNPGVSDRFFIVRSTGACLQVQIVTNAHAAYARGYNKFNKLEGDSLTHICGHDFKRCPWGGPPK